MAITRRAFLYAGVPLLGAAGGLAALDLKFNPHTPIRYPLPPGGRLAPTPDCADLHHEPTHRVTEGPFYKPNTPERRVLRDATTAGVPLTIRGRVLTPDCSPVEGAVLDFWSCDGNGVYDNDGFRLRGHQYTDAGGTFEVVTVKPKDYKQFGIHRTAHVHVKAQARGTRLLTTQLFFPGEPLNAHDWFYDPTLLVDLTRGADGLQARFDFVLG